MYGQKVSQGSLVLLLCILTSPIYGLSSQTKVYGMARRQVAPPTAVLPAPFPPITTANLNPIMTAPNTPATTPATMGAEITSSPASSDTTASDSIPPTSTPDPAAAAASTSSSATIIHITALPPAPSGASTRQRSMTRPFNPRYLAPLFAVLGVALGAFSVWLLFVCRSRRQKGRHRGNSRSLEPGPEYTAPTIAEKSTRNGRVTWRTNPWSTFLGSHHSSPNPCNTAKSNQNWLAKVLPARRSRLRTDPHNPLYHEYTTESFSFLNEDDPFLIPTPSGTTAPSSRGSTDPVGRSQDLLTTSFASVGIAASDDGWEDGPDNSMAQGVIRSEMLERVISGGPKSRRGHARVDSDGNHLEAKTPAADPPAEHNLLLSPGRTKSSTHGTTQPLSPRGNTNAGYRAVDEHPEEAHRAGWAWNLPWVTAEKVLGSDKFTALPSRSAAVEKRKTPMLPPAVSPSPSSSPRPPANLPRADSSVLPSSPPLLNSPPLEAQLFFSSMFGSTPSLTLAVERTSTNSSQAPGLPTRPLQPAKLPSRLPFPAADVEKSNPYRRRLTKSPPSTQQTSPPPPVALTRSATSVSSASSTGSRQVALNKVGQILAKSYSQREMSGVASPTSPTMFGAVAGSPVVQSPDNDAMSSIEQRLAGQT
ncbi:hypothetical protein EUX98_g1450 [Antrodiella citrinella]|uniref:Uncharacterized protein n=1 Tax=Antrodiella citrinella TaxID=2447956 RepID=A0A4S4N1G0_9APHY|nr:hypothetical protein EUX98_g1450 [Antrodiella citrinella]